jgi:hypothetical protein
MTVMVSVLASSAVERWFESRSGQTKDYKIGICCFSAKHAPLRRKSKDWLAQNQNNVSVWSDMSICGLFLRSTALEASTLTITAPMRCFWMMLPREYTLSQYECVPPGERAKTGWLRIMCPCGVTCLSAGCFFSELAQWKCNSACWSSTKRTSSSSHW